MVSSRYGSVLRQRTEPHYLPPLRNAAGLCAGVTVVLQSTNSADPTLPVHLSNMMCVKFEQLQMDPVIKYRSEHETGMVLILRLSCSENLFILDLL